MAVSLCDGGDMNALDFPEIVLDRKEEDKNAVVRISM